VEMEAIRPSSTTTMGWWRSLVPSQSMAAVMTVREPGVAALPLFGSELDAMGAIEGVLS